MTVDTLVDCEGSFATVNEADEEVDVIVSHFHGTGRFERSGKGFRWAVE